MYQKHNPKESVVLRGVTSSGRCFVLTRVTEKGVLQESWSIGFTVLYWRVCSLLNEDLRAMHTEVHECKEYYIFFPNYFHFQMTKEKWELETKLHLKHHRKTADFLIAVKSGQCESISTDSKQHRYFSRSMLSFAGM